MNMISLVLQFSHFDSKHTGFSSNLCGCRGHREGGAGGGVTLAPPLCSLVWLFIFYSVPLGLEGLEVNFQCFVRSIFIWTRILLQES